MFPLRGVNATDSHAGLTELPRQFWEKQFYKIRDFFYIGNTVIKLKYFLLKSVNIVCWGGDSILDQKYENKAFSAPYYEDLIF